MIFLDTSAIYALADKSDENHAQAKKIFIHSIEQNVDFLLHNYIIVESAALIQNRLGATAARHFFEDAGKFSVVFIDELLHSQAYEYWVKESKRRLSFVDCASFVVMHRQRISRAFAFDDDFKRVGFELI